MTTFAALPFWHLLQRKSATGNVPVAPYHEPTTKIWLLRNVGERRLGRLGLRLVRAIRRGEVVCAENFQPNVFAAAMQRDLPALSAFQQRGQFRAQSGQYERECGGHAPILAQVCD